MSSITEISAASFHSEVANVDEPVIVEFFSNSCPHCTKFKPIYEKLSENFKGQAKFLKLNVPLNGEAKELAPANQENTALAQNRGIRALPTLEVFYQGRVIGCVIGYQPLKKLSSTIKNILAKKEENIGPSTPIKYKRSSP